ncbi:transcriptional regulatory protein [Acrasis kona]|uniref:Transcriptional regulatory protein n=1 Tax=Acrasis kona TaxID=1008807 RepID=A0AAW2YW38_9EUKA
MLNPFNNKPVSKSSCITCRKQHKKCDRLLPTCGLCDKRKRVCIYDESTSIRGLQFKIEKGPLAETPSETIEALGVDPSRMLIQTILYNMPVMSKDKILNAVKAIEGQKEGSINTQLTANPEEVGLLYCVYAMWTKYWGKTEQSAKLLDDARNLVGPRLDLICDNYVIAGCCTYLASNFTLDYDFPRARVYSTLLKLFIETRASLNDTDARLLFVEHEYYTIHSLITGVIDLEMMLKKYVERIYSIRKLYNRSFPTADKPYPFINMDLNEENLHTPSEVSAIYTDLRNNNHEMYPLDLERIEKCSQILSMIYMIQNQLKSGMESRYVITTLVTHGARLQYFTRIGDREGARREADAITLLTVQKKVVFRLVGALVSAAAEIHLKDYFDGRGDANLLQVLTDDYTAVKAVSGSSTLWNIRLQDLKIKLEDVIWNYTNQLNALSNQSYTESLSVDAEDNLLDENLTSIIDDDFLPNPGLSEGDFEDVFKSFFE